MILVFDLDDTLYPESTYVKSGMKVVAKMLSENYALEFDATEMRLLEILDQHGRGKVFDIFLNEKKIFSKKIISSCIKKYRHHCPNISLYPGALQAISGFIGKKYLVTDGNKIVQQAKIKALNIEYLFEKTYLTNRYGVINAKPSLHCFKRILERERSNWSNLIYVGDNPTKDFINLNIMGSMTVRVMTGMHESVVCSPENDARIKIKNISDLKIVLKKHYE